MQLDPCPVSLVDVAVCEPCPDGADCRRSNVTFDTLGSMPGYWRNSNESLTFYRGRVSVYCEGGTHSTCRGNRDGPLCM